MGMKIGLFFPQLLILDNAMITLVFVDFHYVFGTEALKCQASPRPPQAWCVGYERIYY